ncbi:MULTISPECIES: 2Fe-2S iron-sulfur cluster-binding protein [Paracoccaceae]|uniref:2Fe-2S iron-sulfur cluster-binding protein n=1 Tax=Paracoccaceae TaxID=31989 RepID=UPI0035B045E1
MSIPSPIALDGDIDDEYTNWYAVKSIQYEIRSHWSNSGKLTATVVFHVDGETFEVESKGEATLMELALRNNIPGIEGECGGNTVCGTCHIVLQKNEADLLPAAKGSELDILSAFDETEATSRLACCIRLADVPPEMSVAVKPLF